MRVIVHTTPHAEREEGRAYLRERIPDAEWSVDQEGSFRMGLIAGLMRQGDDPAVHLEDDVVLTRDWHTKVLTAIEEAPPEAPLVQMFSMQDASDNRLGTGWRPARSFVNTQCWWLAQGLALDLASFLEREWPGRKGRRPDRTADLGIGDYLAELGERFWMHLPSLVQHRDGPSLLGHASGRQASSFTDPWL